MVVTSESIVSARGLQVRLSGRPVCMDIAVDVAPGRLTCLVGPNGSGKTTLLRTIAGLLPYEGSLQLKGREVRDWPARERARTLAFMRQSAAVSFDFSVREFVALGRTPHRRWIGTAPAGEAERIEALLATLDLTALADTPVTHLSGGEQQRLFLAQALAQDTPMLLLDEPTLHLDLYHQYDLLHRLTALVATGKTVLAVVHDLALAARFADAILVLQAGRLVHAGPPADTLTPDLLAAVFRMEAHISPDDGGRLRMDFHQHLSR